MARSGKKPEWERLGAHLRQARLRLEGPPSQSEIGRRAGISPGIISQVERGLQGLSLDSAIRLAAALDIDRHELLRLCGFRPLTSAESPSYSQNPRRPAEALAQVESILLRAGWRPELIRAILRLLRIVGPATLPPGEGR